MTRVAGGGLIDTCSGTGQFCKVWGCVAILIACRRWLSIGFLLIAHVGCWALLLGGLAFDYPGLPFSTFRFGLASMTRACSVFSAIEFVVLHPGRETVTKSERRFRRHGCDSIRVIRADSVKAP